MNRAFSPPVATATPARMLRLGNEDTMAARSTDVTFRNQTTLTLAKTNESIDHGEWTSHPPDTITPGSTVTWRTESDGIATGTEARVSYNLDSPWGGWFQIHRETVFDRARQHISAIARTPTHIDLFVIGFDNAVWSSWWEDDATGWRAWFQIHPETVFDHTTQHVTAIARTSSHIDLFVIGFDNAVWSSWWEADAIGWRPWFQIHKETVFDHTAQHVTAIVRTSGHVDLFVIGFDNAVWSAWWEGDATGWRPWFQIHPDTVFDHATQPIAAISRSQNQLDLFTVGFDNAVWSADWRQNTLYVHWDNPFAGTNLYEQAVTGPCGLYFSGGKGNNCSVTYSLIPDARVAVPGYLPSRQGFAFPNHWPAIHITSITLPNPFGDILIGNASWGLCGGMSFASRDYFEAHQLAPSQTSNPTGEGDPLFDYIVRRLAQSLNAGDAADFVKYADPAYPDTDDPTLGDGRNWQMARVAWPGIRDVIDSGHPCPIGIVIGYIPNFTSLGHQVCVYAYQLREQSLVLWVYDCNLPMNDAVTITLDISQTDQHLIDVRSNVSVPHSPVCFFTQSYERRDPVDGRTG
jgi:hypothetical protein